LCPPSFLAIAIEVFPNNPSLGLPKKKGVHGCPFLGLRAKKSLSGANIWFIPPLFYAL